MADSLLCLPKLLSDLCVGDQVNERHPVEVGVEYSLRRFSQEFSSGTGKSLDLAPGRQYSGVFKSSAGIRQGLHAHLVPQRFRGQSSINGFPILEEVSTCLDVRRRGLRN